MDGHNVNCSVAVVSTFNGTDCSVLLIFYFDYNFPDPFL